MTEQTGPLKLGNAPQDAERAVRLAKALRANLSRRKAQKIARSEQDARKKQQG
jgi:hypothetical protein